MKFQLGIMIITGLTLVSCTEALPETVGLGDSADFNYQENNEKSTESEITMTKSDKVIKLNGVNYKISLVSALDFIKRKGEKPHSTDIESLKKECVLILEVNTDEKIKDIFESKKLLLQKDDAIQYLMGQISSDVTLLQGEDKYLPNGVQYDGELTGVNTFRVFFFLTDLDLAKVITIKYYDRLFGAGYINFKHTDLSN